MQMALSKELGITGIPSLVVIDVKKLQVISSQGRNDVMSNGASAFLQWQDSCTEIDTTVVDMLLDNPPQVFEAASQILVKLLGNVINNPTSLTYRKVKLSNKRIETQLLPANGAFEILFSAGFEEGDDCLILPFSESDHILVAFRDAILKAVLNKNKPEKGKKKNVAVESNEDDVHKCWSDDDRPLSSVFITRNDVKSFETNVWPKLNALRNNLTASQRKILSQILSGVEITSKYENPEAQFKVKQVVPIIELEECAMKKLTDLNSTGEEENKLFLLRDLCVYELLEWFKHKFFQWFDSPTCAKCSTQMRPTGNVSPDPVELQMGAGTIETYACATCVPVERQRFARYHGKPEVLLDTRKGRCGEWANCFGLILRTFQYDVRHVFDFADHVWCEFYSYAEKRWIHVDPCEGVIDKPRMYEKGWGKTLCYVMAASVEEVQDVTKRYVSCPNEELQQRRNSVAEKWLTSTIENIYNIIQQYENDDEKAKERVTTRRLAELITLMNPLNNKPLDPEEERARQSGSLAWRIARAEHKVTVGNAKFTFVPTAKEQEALTVHLEYNVVKDEYVRVSDDDVVIRQWSSAANEVQNVARKEERDWKMVYLSRKDNTGTGMISWTISLEGTDLTVQSVELDVASTTFHGAKVIWQLWGGGSVSLLPTPGTTLKTEQLCGSKSIKLQALLSGGQGNEAWQHTQLFRTSMTNQDESQLRLVVKLKKVV